MAVREVTDDERLDLVRRNITNAAEIVEAVKVAFEDGIKIVPESAVRELTECLNLLNSAYVDLVPVEDDIDLII